MKRQYVIPDLLATLTADALFGARGVRRPDEPAPAERPPGALKRLSTWMRTPRAPAFASRVPGDQASEPTHKEYQ